MPYLFGSQYVTAALQGSRLDEVLRLMTQPRTDTCLATENNKFSDAGATEVAKHLADNQLTYLDLGTYICSPAGLYYLNDGLLKCLFP